MIPPINAQSCPLETALVESDVLAKYVAGCYVLLQNNVLLPQCSWLFSSSIFGVEKEI
jgi:hypothetical protein